jgi:hypothetical protein
MPKGKTPELPPEAQAKNKAVETKRAKNAEKQKRFRDNMKADGFKRVTLWDIPGPSGKRITAQGFRQVPAWEETTRKYTNRSRAAKLRFAVQIREKSLHAAARLPEVKKALSRAAGEFLAALGDAPEAKAVFGDYLELIKLLEDPRGE